MKKLLLATAIIGVLASPAYAVDFAYNGVFTDNGTSGQLNYSGTFNVTSFSIGVPVPGFLVVNDLLTISRSNAPFAANAESITATFNFYDPGAASGAVGGTGTEVTFFGAVLNGLIDWSGPGVANFGGGNSLLITLADTPYNAISLHHGLDIDARFDVTGTFAVPGPAIGAGVPGLIAGALGLWGIARRRRQQMA